METLNFLTENLKKESVIKEYLELLLTLKNDKSYGI